MESVKMKKATKTVAFRQLAIYCNIVDNQLLTDAKMLEYIPQHLVGRNLTADNLRQVEQAFSQVLAHQVARQAHVHTFLHTVYGL